MEKPKYPRGKILGGTSSINGMVYLRGSPHDYDSWQDHGAKGWSWKDVEVFFKKVENAFGDEVSDSLGRGGMLNITHGYRSPMFNELIKAGKEIGIKEVDYFEEAEGISRLVCTYYEGIRQTSSDSFLRPVYEERKDRLHIVTNARVGKVLFDTDENGKVTANGVTYIKNGEEKIVKARKEVILSAGVMETPHILMLSGIGPRNHLKDMMIDVVVDAPGVGSNMEDHLSNAAYFKLKSPQYYGQNKNSMEEYILNGTGALTTVAGIDGVLHYRTKYFGTNVSLSTRKRPFPTIEALFAPAPFTIPFSTQEKPAFHSSVILYLQHPKSRGTVRLNSTNPFDQPIIDPNFLSNPDDVKMHIEGFRQLEKFEMTKTMKETGFRMVVPDVCNGQMNKYPPRSDEFYECYMKSFSHGIHACCTAKMGDRNNEMAVVDERLRVRGVHGLRIADASVMPHITSSNTQAPCYMIGQRASDMIKEDWRLI
uniref:oxygen-dependent choline dehydrogenase-like n=1 Tax=Styela clava TaxID=7725 RepID=UPI00193970AF|nr:oxygen-dependent choline dehydrogenase-like [Styela clava]